MYVCVHVWVCVRYRSEQDAVIAEQLQSAEMVGRENERLQIEMKDAVSNASTQNIATAMHMK